MKSIKAYIFIILWGVIFIFNGANIFLPVFHLMTYGIHTTGEVTSVVENNSSEWNNTYAPVVHYTCGMKDVTATPNLYTSPSLSIGDKLPLFCSENNPEEFIIDDFINKYFGLIFIFVGFIGICIWLGIFLYQGRRNDAIILLKANGEYIKGKVISINENIFITVMHKHPFKITAEYCD